MIRNIMFKEELNRYYSVWQKFNYVYGEWAKKHGLSVNGLLVLYAVYEGGEDCTQKKLGQKWLIPKQTINMILKDFEKIGYIELLPLQEDKRNKEIRFTTEGKNYADHIISELRKVEFLVIEKMGAERIKELNEDTELFVELFSQAGSINSLLNI